MTNPIYKGEWITSPSKVPKGEHWVILRSESVTIPGDERSRTAPGHGYPEHTDHYLTYQVFTNEAEFKAAMAAEMESGLLYRTIRGIHVDKTYGAITRAEVMIEEAR